MKGAKNEEGDDGGGWQGDKCEGVGCVEGWCVMDEGTEGGDGQTRDREREGVFRQRHAIRDPSQD